MPIPTRCPGCQELYQLADKFAGKKVRCKKCQEILTVPDSSPTNPIQPEPSRPKSAAMPEREQRRPALREHDKEEMEALELRSVRRSNRGWLIGLGVGCLGLGVLLLGGGVIVAILFVGRMGKNTEEEAPAGADAVTKQLFALKSSKFPARMEALRQLQAMVPNERREEVARALESLLNEENPFLREEAIAALGTWGTKESVPRLLQILNIRDEVGGVLDRRAAMMALGHLKDERAAEPIAERLENFFDREDAAKALRKLGPAAEKAMRKRLHHPDADIRNTACDILNLIGTRESIPALEKIAAEEGNPLAKKAKQAIQAITARQ
jgi:HEAT repeat protein